MNKPYNIQNRNICNGIFHISFFKALLIKEGEREYGRNDSRGKRDSGRNDPDSKLQCTLVAHVTIDCIYFCLSPYKFVL